MALNSATIRYLNLQEKQCFQPHGPVPSTKMMREFLFYLANGSYGWELDGQITRQMAVYIYDAMALFCTIKRCNCNLEKDVREQVLVLIWPRYNLTQRTEPHQTSRRLENPRSQWRCLSSPPRNDFASWPSASPFDVCTLEYG